MQILQVIPRLPPPTCGVADYALSLARPLKDLHHYESCFISASPPRDQNQGQAGFPIEFLQSHTPSALREAVLRHPSASGVLLQYSGYGFAPRGAPVWLVRALLQLKKLGRMPPLHVMFHELWFRGKITNSSFWNWPLQRWGVRKLCSLASTITTNREIFADQLESVLPPSQSKACILPVFSNFGEPAHLPNFGDRAPDMAFFGWPMPTETAFLLSKQLKSAVAQVDAKRLVVFRHPLPDGVDPGIPVETHDVLPAQVVSARLMNCRYAFSDYPPHNLGKSGLFAAYCAHGLATILEGGSGNLTDGLIGGTHVLPLLVGQSIGAIQASSIASAALEWYRGHDLHSTAASFAEKIGTTTQTR